MRPVPNRRAAPAGLNLRHGARALLLASLASIVSLAGTPPASAQPAPGAPAAPQLQPVDARITDEAIQADLKTYEAMQQRLHALNEGGRRVADYHLAKAQCWLDVSFHEYTRNDRGPFPQAALAESAKLVAGMERGQSPLPDDTPLVGEAVRLREDLWARDAALKQHPGWRCAQAKAACGEVELVHAGNEHAQQQWRHAKPYVQIAEDLFGQAQALAEQCATPPAPVVALPAAAPAREREFALAIVFAFDRDGEADIRPFSRVQLDALVAQIRREGRSVEAVALSGHADRLHDAVAPGYNLALSERRAATVRAMLARDLGIAADRITVQAVGDQEPVANCAGAAEPRSRAALEECLLPDRRVDVRITTREAVAAGAAAPAAPAAPPVPPKP